MERPCQVSALVTPECCLSALSFLFSSLGGLGRPRTADSRVSVTWVLSPPTVTAGRLGSLSRSSKRARRTRRFRVPRRQGPVVPSTCRGSGHRLRWLEQPIGLLDATTSTSRGSGPLAGLWSEPPIRFSFTTRNTWNDDKNNNRVSRVAGDASLREQSYMERHLFQHYRIFVGTETCRCLVESLHELRWDSHNARALRAVPETNMSRRKVLVCDLGSAGCW